MDVEFQMINVNKQFGNDLLRITENFDFNFKYVDKHYVPTRNSETVELKNWTGQELLLSFVKMVNHRRYKNGVEFYFGFHGKKSFTVVPKQCIWQPGNGCIRNFPAYRELPDINGENFQTYFTDFLSGKLGDIDVESGEDESFWQLAVWLCFEMARSVHGETLNRFYETPVTVLITMALDIGQLTSKEMLEAFEGMSQSRKKASELLIIKYTKDKFASMVDEFFEEDHAFQDDEEEQMDETALKKIKDELICTLPRYFEASVKEEMRNLYLNEAYVDQDDEEDNMLAQIRVELTECLRRFCYCLHGEFAKKGGVFDKSGKTKDQAESEMIQEAFGILFQREPEVPVSRLKTKRRRILDDDDDD